MRGTGGEAGPRPDAPCPAAPQRRARAWHTAMPHPLGARSQRRSAEGCSRSWRLRGGTAGCKGGGAEGAAVSRGWAGHTAPATGHAGPTCHTPAPGQPIYPPATQPCYAHFMRAHSAFSRSWSSRSWVTKKDHTLPAGHGAGRRGREWGGVGRGSVQHGAPICLARPPVPAPALPAHTRATYLPPAAPGNSHAWGRGTPPPPRWAHRPGA